MVQNQALRNVAKRVLPLRTWRGLVARRFHWQYYRSLVWQDTQWLGHETWKCPFDLWVYQELIHELRPDLIVETGTKYGGSAFYLASICELVGTGRVVTIDIEQHPGRPAHPRLEYLLGSSVDPEVVRAVERAAQEAERVLVVLDADHSRDHVLAELRAYAPLVTAGSYLVVEDTNANGHPVLPDFGPGPMEAVDAFLREGDGFAIDRTREKHGLTFSPRGYLRKAGGPPRPARPTTGT